MVGAGLVGGLAGGLAGDLAGGLAGTAFGLSMMVFYGLSTAVRDSKTARQQDSGDRTKANEGSGGKECGEESAMVG